MKQIFYTTAVALTIVFVATSCKDGNRLETGSVQTVPVSTTEFQEFQAWKQQQLNQQQLNQQQLNTTNAVAYPVSRKPATRTVTKTRVVEKPVYVQQPKKKGWSKAAKGTAIGAGAGAAAGALIVKKNRALGAVIGGVVGGGVGYGIGRSQDKKDGRY
jgi:hypothetical protein